MKRALVLALFLSPVVPAAEPLVSGLQPGQRPGPYSSIVCVGEKRGQAHCYICEAAERPTAIVFARTMTDPLGKLVQGLDRALATHKDAGLRSWVTFAYPDQSVVDADVVKWGKTHAIRNVPLAVFEDADGPPAYRLGKDAEITVLLSVNQKVVKNFSFRPGELTASKVREVLKALPLILKK
jgi:hypothetical protein